MPKMPKQVIEAETMLPLNIADLPYGTAKKFDSIMECKKHLHETYKVVTMSTRFSLLKVVKFITSYLKLSCKLTEHDRFKFTDGSVGFVLVAFNDIEDKTVYFAKPVGKTQEVELYKVR